MLITRKRHRLAARWHPVERDIHFDLSPRIGDSDLHWLYNKMFTKENMLELENRGFDLASMRFHVDKSAEAINRHEQRMGRSKAE